MYSLKCRVYVSTSTPGGCLLSFPVHQVLRLIYSILNFVVPVEYICWKPALDSHSQIKGLIVPNKNLAELRKCLNKLEWFHNDLFFRIQVISTESHSKEILCFEMRYEHLVSRGIC